MKTSFNEILENYENEGYKKEGKRKTKLANYVLLYKEKDGLFSMGHEGIYLYHVEGDVSLAHTNDFLKRYQKMHYDKNFSSDDKGMLSYTGNLNTKEFRKIARSVLDSDEYRRMVLKKQKSSTPTSKKKIPKRKAKRRRILSADRSEILERQKEKCDSCGKKLDLVHRLYEIDHKTAISDGGKDTLANFHALCLECHRKKTRKEATARAKVKHQSSVASKKPETKKPVKKKTIYKCKLSTRDREWDCGKKNASRSCLKRGLFDSRCEYLTVSRK